MEDQDYATRFDIDLLTERLGYAVRFVRTYAPSRELPVGLFGASTGAAAALRVAAALYDGVRAVVSRGGRPNLTGGDLLEQVKAPTLLIVGELDYQVIALNESARDTLTHCHRELVIVPGATHLFEEPGAPEEVAAPRGTVVHSSYDFNSNPTRPRASVIGVDLQSRATRAPRSAHRSSPAALPAALV